MARVGRKALAGPRIMNQALQPGEKLTYEEIVARMRTIPGRSRTAVTTTADRLLNAGIDEGTIKFDRHGRYYHVTPKPARVKPELSAEYGDMIADQHYTAGREFV